MKAIHGKRGMTLIEVVASLGIIGVGIVGILAIFPVAIDAGARASDRTAATLLGQYVIDQVGIAEDAVNQPSQPRPVSR